ncbi:KRUF family protein, partial [Toxoplasma gondii TgCatPRC2]
VSEAELEAAQALLALSARSAIDTSGTQEEPAASAAAAPPGGRGATPGAADPTAASDTSTHGSSNGTYLQVGLSKLKKEAAELREKLSDKTSFIVQQAAVRLAQSTNVDPTDRRIDQWLTQARARYYNSSPLWQQKAEKLEALAAEWERQIATGAVTPLRPVEGTPSRKKAIKQAAGPDPTAGRPGASGFLLRRFPSV